MEDARFSQRAIELAVGHRTHPNPRVGAVVVDDSGSVVGEGTHLGPGLDHAEIIALRNAGEKGRGATLYVSLEPCTHHGRTPPCAEAIIQAGIRRVVVGVEDPDGRVSGSGIALLTQAGIATSLADAEAAEALDPGYFRHRRTGLPLVTLKYAMTLDGSVAAQDGSSQWITGEEARADGHRLRSEADAVVIGAGTLRSDDPALTARHLDAKHQPRPVVVAGSGELPADAQLWGRNPLVVSADERSVPGGETVVVAGEGGLPNPEATARAIAELGYYDLLMEGGPTLAGAWWKAGLIDRGVVYLGGKVGGGRGVAPLGGLFASFSEARGVEIVEVARLGRDVKVEFR